MLNFNRFRAGVYQAHFEGSTIRIAKEGAAYWALYVAGEFLDSHATLTAATVAANGFVGYAATIPAKPASKPRAAKLPAIMHNPKGLYIFGLDEICAMLAKSRECDPALPGIAIEHRSQRGTRGYFVDASAAPDFWLLCSEEIPGTPALCMGEGKRWEVKL